MWPWEKTAVWSRPADHRRTSSWTMAATGELPVSTRTSPSSVVEGRDVGEGGQEGHPVADLDQLPHVADRVEVGGVDLAAPEPVGQVEHVVGHLRTPSSAGAGRAARGLRG